jgi:hypothetical protein
MSEAYARRLTRTPQGFLLWMAYVLLLAAFMREAFASMTDMVAVVALGIVAGRSRNVANCQLDNRPH